MITILFVAMLWFFMALAYLVVAHVLARSRNVPIPVGTVFFVGCATAGPVLLALAMLNGMVVGVRGTHLFWHAPVAPPKMAERKVAA